MKLLSILLASVICTGCGFGVLWQDEPYEIHWIDTYSNKTLAYSLGSGGSIGRIEAEVIAVGSNHSYVVAKRRDTRLNSVFYYYIDRNKDNKHNNRNKITKGPYSHKEFTEISKTLQLPNFTHEFE